MTMGYNKKLTFEQQRENNMGHKKKYHKGKKWVIIGRNGPWCLKKNDLLGFLESICFSPFDLVIYTLFVIILSTFLQTYVIYYIFIKLSFICPAYPLNLTWIFFTVKNH